MLGWLKNKRKNLEAEKRIQSHIQESILLMEKLFVDIKNEYEDNEPSGYFMDMLALHYNNPYGFILKEGCSLNYPFVIITDSIIRKKEGHSHYGNPYLFYYHNKKIELDDEGISYLMSSEDAKEIYCHYISTDNNPEYEKSTNQDVIRLENLLININDGLNKSIYFYSKTIELFKNNISDDEINEFIQEHKENKNILILMLPFLYKQNKDIAIRLSKFCIEQELNVDREMIQDLLKSQKEKIDLLSKSEKAQEYCHHLINCFLHVSEEMNFFESIKMNKELTENLTDKISEDIVQKKNKI